MVGDGTSNTARHNAFEVFAKNGTTPAYAFIGGKKVLTESMMPKFKSHPTTIGTITATVAPPIATYGLETGIYLLYISGTIGLVDVSATHAVYLPASGGGTQNVMLFGHNYATVSVGYDATGLSQISLTGNGISADAEINLTAQIL